MDILLKSRAKRVEFHHCSHIAGGRLKFIRQRTRLKSEYQKSTPSTKQQQNFLCDLIAAAVVCQAHFPDQKLCITFFSTRPHWMRIRKKKKTLAGWKKYFYLTVGSAKVSGRADEQPNLQEKHAVSCSGANSLHW